VLPAARYSAVDAKRIGSAIFTLREMCRNKADFQYVYPEAAETGAAFRQTCSVDRGLFNFMAITCLSRQSRIRMTRIIKRGFQRPLHAR
jgi:hypothetical protein